VSDPLAVVGGDAAGMSAAAVARRRDPDRDVLVLGRGPYTSYSACGIPYFIGRPVDGPDRLIARSPDEFRQASVDAGGVWSRHRRGPGAGRVASSSRSSGEHRSAHDKNGLKNGPRPPHSPCGQATNAARSATH